MAWKIELSREAKKALSKRDSVTAQRIAKGLRRISAFEDPRNSGKAMTGQYAGHWRYRFGSYRAIAQIENGRMVIVVIAIGHHREVYR